jgi:serine/threonine protein kinase
VTRSTTLPTPPASGAGAFRTVYLAYDPDLNRDGAIKVSSHSLAKTARVRSDAIATEARHAASLNRPGIVTIHDLAATRPARDNRRRMIVECLRNHAISGGA